MTWFSSDYAKDIWNKKYRHDNETLDEWFARVSGGNKELEQRMREKKFLFGGRILASRGLASPNKKVTYSNCYVLPAPEDNIPSIMDTGKNLALTFSRGGGVGIDISNLRPKDAPVRNSAETTTGAVSFMDYYDAVTGLICQKGRRGALIITMDAEHPDIHEFIDKKLDLEKVTHANISVKVTDNFMQLASSDKDGVAYDKQFTLLEDDGTAWYNREYTVQPKAILNHIAHNNHRMGEPGLLFWDRIQNWNFLQKHDTFKYEGVNPCGELPLPAYGSCNLGSINLSQYVKNPFTENAYFDMPSFIKDIKLYVYALNDVLIEGMELHPIKEQREVIKKYRQIGLGVMGIADALIKLQMKYDGSPQTLEFLDKIWDTLINESVKASASYMTEKQYTPYEGFKMKQFVGCDFATFNLQGDTIDAILDAGGVFNSQFLTIPPTGSISSLLECSSGIEPNFEWEYDRKVETIYPQPKKVHCIAGIVKEYVAYAKEVGLVEYPFEGDRIFEGYELPTYFVTALDGVSYMDKIKVQAQIQKHIDGSISSTVNLNRSVTEEKIKDLYIEAWKHGCKGITVYRNGCEREGVLTTKEEPVKKGIVSVDLGKEGGDITAIVINGKTLARGEKKPVASDTIYYRRKVRIGCGELSLFIGYSEKENAIQDFWVKREGTGGCERNLESTVISMSLVQRLGGSYEMLEKAFNGIGSCSSFVRAKAKGEKLSRGTNCGQAIFNAITDFEKEIKGDRFVLKTDFVDNLSAKFKDKQISKETMWRNKCPECGEPLEKQGGCYTCTSCGYNKCE